MFNVAPRYLSGISVFLGDDITEREVTGELVVLMGPATKGPSSAVTLRSIDSLVPLFGSNNPLAKAAHQFWDGYVDAGATNSLQLVAMRIGGIAATLANSFGVVIETEDAYNGIEDEYYVYICDVDAESFNVKVWDKDRLLVFDYLNAIDTRYVKVTVPDITGTTGKLYGTDIDNDPLNPGLTLAELTNKDQVAPGGLFYGTTGAGPVPGASSIVLSDEHGSQDSFASFADLFPSTGKVRISGKIGAVKYEEFISYSEYDSETNTFTLSAETTVDFSGVAATDMRVEYIGSTLIKGDSELDLTDRQLYEKMRNMLLEVETWTPDYIVTGGGYFDAKGTYVSGKTAVTVPTTAQVAGPETADTALSLAFVEAEAAATWADSGTAKLDSGLELDLGDGNGLTGVSQYIRYSGITTVDDGQSDTDYRLNVTFDQFEVSANYVGDSQVLYVKQKASGPAIDKLMPEGWFRISKAGQTLAGYYKLASVTDGVAKLAIHVPANQAAEISVHVSGAAEFDADGDGALPIATDTFELCWMPFGTNDTYLHGYWTEIESYETGIGYVKETDQGDCYTFEWSDEPQIGYGLAHFGYLIANFCNEATIGYNTPLTGMNMTPPTAFDRASVIQWIGSKAAYKMVAGEPTAIEAVSASGTGLLGNAIMAGSERFNRTYLNDTANNKFVDPAYGLLMTNDGFVDGSETRDTYGNVVDLGKFMCVGAGLLTFVNAASGTPYTETCGLYSIGMLAGSPKEQGISFKQIGKNSGTTISVIVNRKLYNDLVNLGYIVITREKGLGWVINNDHSVARKDSGYRLISTTRIVKTVIEAKRQELVSFIGKPINTFYYEAAKTKMADSFKNDVSLGLLNGYNFNLEASKAGQAIGKLYLRVVLNPPLELTQVDIDTVIDRNVTTS